MKLPTQDLLAAATEGRLSAAMRHENEYGDLSPTPAQAIFRVLVLDVIHDPFAINDDKVEYYRSVLNVTNSVIAQHVPRNTIIGRRIGDAGSSASPPMFFFPFMPSHLALPCKAGEHVWAMFEAPDTKRSNVGWWMCKIIELDHTDDVNHSHAPRNFDNTFFKGGSSIALAKGSTSPVYDFQNGTAETIDGERIINPSTTFVDGDENTYERLLTDSDASHITTYEAVPKYRKRPPDLAFEGSNNTLIVLGTDRVGVVSDTTDDVDHGPIPKYPVTDITGSAGCIHLVAGRGQTPLTSGVSVTNSLSRQEIAKSLQERTPNEGDIDLINDKSYINISQRTLIDTNLQIDGFNSQFSINDTNPTPITAASGDGAVTLSSDKVRIIARKDIEFLVKGSGTDTTKWAAIVLKSNGDIVFKPGDNGVIKLGGEDASLAVMCTVAPAGAVSGSVSAAPIISTMGGAVGTGTAGQGEWATKVLIK